MFQYPLSHTRFNQIIDHEHEIYLHEKLSTKLLTQAANKIPKLFTKTGRLLFLEYGFRSGLKNSKQTLP